jgi:hypothetical protein
VNVDSDNKSLLVAGDHESIVEILESIYEYEKKKGYVIHNA